MSQWTHVNGIIRIDALRFMGMKSPNIGIPSLWEDDHDAKDIPCGSEGSLNAELWTNPSENSLSAFTVSIFGDLRDYDDVDEIVKYLNQITEGGLVRSGVCEIDVEFKFTYLYHYVNEKWVEISKKEKV